MKIHKTIQPQPVTYEKTAKAKRNNGARFDDLLSSQLDQARESSAPASPPVAAMDPATSLVSFSTDASSYLAQASTAVEKALDQWSALSDLLQSSDASPKEVQDQIQSLVQQSEDLQGHLQGVAEDHPLRRIADELSVFSYVESVKWNRGDYL